jgi:hypothetical protein
MNPAFRRSLADWFRISIIAAAQACNSSVNGCPGIVIRNTIAAFPKRGPSGNRLVVENFTFSAFPMRARFVVRSIYATSS